MSATSRGSSSKILAFSCVVEVATAVALLVDPAIVVRLLLGAEVSGAATILGRCFGIGLLALGVACWPGRQHGGPAPLRGMATYNALIALYLAYLGAAGHSAGLLLWPAVGLHALVALLLVWTGTRTR